MRLRFLGYFIKSGNVAGDSLVTPRVPDQVPFLCFPEEPQHTMGRLIRQRRREDPRRAALRRTGRGGFVDYSFSSSVESGSGLTRPFVSSASTPPLLAKRRLPGANSPRPSPVWKHAAASQARACDVPELCPAEP